MENLCERHNSQDGESWEEFDGYGIFLCRVCDKCRAEKLRKFRGDIFDRYETCEEIG